MSVVLELEDEINEPIAPPRSAPRGDSLAASVLILLIMTVAQRVIGFGRGILFCRWLDAEQLGQWDVAFGFLNLAAPLAVLNLPGSFGRYVEYFRLRGQFGVFLRRTSLVGAVTCTGAIIAMLVFRDWFSELIFGSTDQRNLVVWLAVCLATVAAHNYLTALFIAVRRYRIVTALQFFQSLGFALVSLGLLVALPTGASSIVVGYAVATILSSVAAVSCLRSLAACEPAEASTVGQRAFWAKLIPFTVWMWITSLLANLFEVIDRYMIIHHSGLDANEALRQVGYYHTSRIVPLLFVAVAGLLGSMITPHLSQDWELGRREAVGRRLNLVLKGLLGTMFAASVVVLFLAPYLFKVAFQNKFQGGLEVLPWTLTYCAWFGTIAVAQNYLFCAERPWASSLSLAIGLCLNIAANLVLLPRYGLEGAVWATTLANLAALSLVYVFSQRHGMRVEAGTWLLTLSPLTLGLGPWTALATLVALVVCSLATPWIFNRQEKRQFLLALEHGRQKLSRLLRRGQTNQLTSDPT